MMKSDIRRKHIPERTCIACRRKRSKSELIRIVRTPGGDVKIDAQAKESGRGAYICRLRSCWEDSFKKKRIEHMLRVNVTSDEYDDLLELATKLFCNGEKI